MTKPSINAIQVKCLDCNEEYFVEPTRVVGDHAWYSSNKDHCRKCESMNLENLSFLHPEEVHLNVYPSVEELIPPVLRAKLPAALIEEVSERYESLGGKYLSTAIHDDGRQINGMMYTDRILNCREEIVDGVFCILGQVFKETVVGNEPNDVLYELLSGLIEIYTALKFIENQGDYVIAVNTA